MVLIFLFAALAFLSLTQMFAGSNYIGPKKAFGDALHMFGTLGVLSFFGLVIYSFFKTEWWVGAVALLLFFILQFPAKMISFTKYGNFAGIICFGWAVFVTEIYINMASI